MSPSQIYKYRFDTSDQPSQVAAGGIGAWAFGKL